MCNEKTGVRDKWLAHLRTRDTKCLLQTYRDNRFNAVFECPAAVLHHLHDIRSLLDLVDGSNWALWSLKADINDDSVVSMVHAFAIMYVKITGPYWDITTSRRISYLDLYQYIQPLESTVNDWLENPKSVLTSPGPLKKEKFSKHITFKMVSTASPLEVTFFIKTLIAILKGMAKCI